MASLAKAAKKSAPKKVVAKKAPAANIKKAEKGNRYQFEGKSMQSDSIVRGEVVAKTEDEARQKLARRQIKIIQLTKMKKQRQKKITSADITVFTRQLSTMMKACFPLMQAFDFVA